MAKNTQMTRVLQYMHENGSITRLEAMQYLGVANLPAVIEVLRNDMGYKIITYKIPGENRYGEEITYARYCLEE